MDTVTLQSTDFAHAPGLVRNVHHSFKVGDRHVGFLLLSGWPDLPMWAAARIAAGKCTVEGDTVVIDRADQDTETAEYFACFAPKPEPEDEEED